MSQRSLTALTQRARCVDRLSWQGAVYVTLSESIGEIGERVVFQNLHALEPAFSAAGKAGRRDVADVSKLANVLSILGRLITDSEFEARLQTLERNSHVV